MAEKSPDESDGARPGPRRDGKGARYLPEFEAFWAEYPRKVRKQDALRAWSGAKRSGGDADSVVSAARAYAEAVKTLGRMPDMVLHAATFLNRERWRGWLPPDGEEFLEARAVAKQRVSPGNGRGNEPLITPLPKTYAEAKANVDRKLRERAEQVKQRAVELGYIDAEVLSRGGDKP